MMDDITAGAEIDEGPVQRKEIGVRGFAQPLCQQQERLQYRRLPAGVVPSQKSQGRTWKVQRRKALEIPERDVRDGHLRNSNS